MTSIVRYELSRVRGLESETRAALFTVNSGALEVSLKSLIDSIVAVTPSIGTSTTLRASESHFFAITVTSVSSTSPPTGNSRPGFRLLGGEYSLSSIAKIKPSKVIVGKFSW